MSAVEERKVAWVTGAGSGMGAASAQSLAASGWRVVLSGRTRRTLDETASAIRDAGAEATVVPLDVADGAAVAAARDEILATAGRIDALVLAAGLNTPRRRWEDQRMAEFSVLLDTNLLGPATVIDASLPELRRRHGVVVLVSSYSAWAFNPVAGVAYSASKSALGQLARTLNAQEAEVRACHLCPGDVATDFLRHRAVVPSPEAQAAMLTPDDIGRTVQFVLDSPAHVRFDEIVVSPISQR